VAVERIIQIDCGRLPYFGTGNREGFNAHEGFCAWDSYSPRAAWRRWARPRRVDTDVTICNTYSGAVPLAAVYVMYVDTLFNWKPGELSLIDTGMVTWPKSSHQTYCCIHDPARRGQCDSW
jgi:hypothetical protein